MLKELKFDASTNNNRDNFKLAGLLSLKIKDNFKLAGVLSLKVDANTSKYRELQTGRSVVFKFYMAILFSN